MTTTFIKFLEQFNSTGSDKAQGYDESHFIGLSEEEKNKAFALLEEELIAPGVIGWLFFLDAKKAEAALLKYLVSSGKQLAGLHRVLIALYHYTQNERYLNDFEADFHQLYEWEKDDAVQLYAGYVNVEERKSRFFKKIIVDEKNSDALASAADLYLRLHGVPVGTPEQRTYFFSVRKLLQSQDLEDKRRGFKLIGEL